MLRPWSSISPKEIRPVSGIPEAAGGDGEAAHEGQLEPRLLDEPGGERIEAAGHDPKPRRVEKGA